MLLAVSSANDLMAVLWISYNMNKDIGPLIIISRSFEHKIVIIFLSIDLNMFWVPKRTVYPRQFFWVPTTYVFVEK